MTKKIETEVPDWAEWIAKSRGGLVRVFSERPIDISNKGGYFPASGSKVMVIGKGGPAPNWRNTLRKI